MVDDCGCRKGARCRSCLERENRWLRLVIADHGRFFTIDEESGCWLWSSKTGGSGYGSLMRRRKSYTAHRYIYELLVGPIPEGLVLDHLCRNRACANPSHLEPVTQRENNMRALTSVTYINATKTHCKRGHAFAEHGEVVRRGKYVGRRCIVCRRSDQRARDRAKAAAA